MSGSERLESAVGPVFVEVDGALVAILEVLKLQTAGKTIGYWVVAEAKDGEAKSPRFGVMATSWSDLIRKLRIEVAKWRTNREVLQSVRW